MTYDKEYLDWFLGGFKPQSSITKTELDKDFDKEFMLRSQRHQELLEDLAEEWEWLGNQPFDTFKRYELDYIRDMLEMALNQYGGYIQRDYHYLSYYSLISVIIPNGTEIWISETDRAWKGQKHSIYVGMNDHFYRAGLYKKNPDALAWKQRFGTLAGSPYKNECWFFKQTYEHGRTFVENWYEYDPEVWNKKLVILKNVSFDYSEPLVDKMLEATLGDLNYFRIPTGQKRFYRSNREKAYKVAGITRGSYYDLIKWETNELYTRSYFNIGIFISELRLLLTWLRDKASVTAYPLFLNMGFYKTMAYEPIRINWQVIREIITAYLNDMGVFDVDE